MINLSAPKIIENLLKDWFPEICAGAFLVCFLIWWFDKKFKLFIESLGASELIYLGVIILWLASTFISIAVVISFKVLWKWYTDERRREKIKFKKICNTVDVYQAHMLMRLFRREEPSELFETEWFYYNYMRIFVDNAIVVKGDIERGRVVYYLMVGNFSRYLRDNPRIREKLSELAKLDENDYHVLRQLHEQDHR